MDKEITWGNIEKKIKLLNLNVDKGTEAKFGEIIEKAEEKITDWMLKEKIRNWKELEEAMESKKEENINLDEFAEICIRDREIGEPIEDYIEFMEEQLRQYNIKEETIIKILSINTWPRKPYLKNDLSSCKTIMSLKYKIKLQAKKEVEIFKRIEGKYCQICKMKGHVKEVCRRATTP
jgi:hypothetical protein